MIIGSGLIAARLSKLGLADRIQPEEESSEPIYLLPTLPEEVVVLILSNLSDAKDLSNVAHVSTVWRRAAQANANGDGWRAAFLHEFSANEQEALQTSIDSEEDASDWTWRRKYMAALKDKTRQDLRRKARMFESDFDAWQLLERQLENSTLSEEEKVTATAGVQQFKEIVDKQIEAMDTLRRRTAALEAALQLLTS